MTYTKKGYGIKYNAVDYIENCKTYWNNLQTQEMEEKSTEEYLIPLVGKLDKKDKTKLHQSLINILAKKDSEFKTHEFKQVIFDLLIEEELGEVANLPCSNYSSWDEHSKNCEGGIVECDYRYVIQKFIKYFNLCVHRKDKRTQRRELLALAKRRIAVDILDVSAVWLRDCSVVPDGYKIDKKNKAIIAYEVEKTNPLTEFKMHKYGQLWEILEYAYWDLHLIAYDRYGNPRFIDLREVYYQNLGK